MAALWATYCQIQLSNRQQLFDRRLTAYVRTKAMLAACEHSYELLYPQNYKGDPVYDITQVFMNLTRNTYIEHYAENVWDSKTKSDYDLFTEKCEALDDYATEMKFIFAGKSADAYSKFLKAYQLALLSLFVYERALRGAKLGSVGFTKINEVEPNSTKEEWRKQAYEAMENLKKAFDTAAQPDIRNDIEKQLALVKENRFVSYLRRSRL